MAIIIAHGGLGIPQSANLSAAQVGNGDSTNIADRGPSNINPISPAVVYVATAIGATPTCTYSLLGSNEGTVWFQLPYSDGTTPGTLSVATFVITTAGTAIKHISSNYCYRYVKVTMSANTNVTNTIDAWFL